MSLKCVGICVVYLLYNKSTLLQYLHLLYELLIFLPPRNEHILRKL